MVKFILYITKMMFIIFVWLFKRRSNDMSSKMLIPLLLFIIIGFYFFRLVIDYEGKSRYLTGLIQRNGLMPKLTYDAQGRTQSIETPEGIISYTYDEFGRQTSVQTDNDPPTIYSYDNYGRLSSVTSDGKTTKYEYDSFGNLDKTTLPNGVITTYEYDNAGRLIKEVFDHYDDNFDQTSEWIYDLVGNRLKQTVNGKETLYGYDSNDRLLNEISGTKKTVYGYNHTQQTSKTVTENGELVSTTTYEYDLQGRMSVVTIVTGNRKEITKYEYGADGIRVSAEHEIYIDGQLQSKTRTKYLNDPKSLTGYSQVLRQTEYDADGNIIKTISYVIGHQRISQTIEQNGEKITHYFTFDFTKF